MGKSQKSRLAVTSAAWSHDDHVAHNHLNTHFDIIFTTKAVTKMNIEILCATSLKK